MFGCAGSLLLPGLFTSCGEWGLLSRCGAWVSRCGGFSCLELGLQGTRAQQLWLLGFRAQAQ